MAKGVKTELAERLDPLLPGFARERWLWNRRSGEVIQVLDLYGSKHGTGQLSLDWGLAPVGWATLGMGADEPDMHTAASCAIGGSLGDFHGNSGWWSHQDVSRQVPDDLRHLIQSHLLPFFDEMTSVKAVLAVAARGYRAYPRPASALDKRGWPLCWTWPRRPEHQKLVQGTLMILSGSRAEGRDRLSEASGGEWAQQVLAREGAS